MGERELLEIQPPVEGVGGRSYTDMESDLTASTLPVRSKSGAQVDTFPKRLDLNPLYGRVAYTQGPDLDQPLSLTRYAYVDRILLFPNDSALDRISYRQLGATSQQKRPSAASVTSALESRRVVVGSRTSAEEEPLGEVQDLHAGKVSTAGARGHA